MIDYTTGNQVELKDTPVEKLDPFPGDEEEIVSTDWQISMSDGLNEYQTTSFSLVN